MASVALGRVSGSILSVPPARTGIFKPGTARAGDTWSIETANVLVADTNVTAVQLPRRDNTGTFDGLDTRNVDKGDIVDFLVEFSIYNGDVQARVLGLWPADDVSYLAA